MFVIVVHTVDTDGTNVITTHGGFHEPDKANQAAARIRRYLDQEHRGDVTSVSVHRMRKPTRAEVDAWH